MKRKAIYTFRLKFYSILMLFSLAWLTVSVAFTPSNQTQQVSTQTAEEEQVNPFGNGTEEKTETGSNTLSEYLHDHHLLSHNFAFLVQGRKSHPPSLYSDFDPELILPPPKNS